MTDSLDDVWVEIKQINEYAKYLADEIHDSRIYFEGEFLRLCEAIDKIECANE